MMVCKYTETYVGVFRIIFTVHSVLYNSFYILTKICTTLFVSHCYYRAFYNQIK
jgi:hypothetical protein